MKNDSAVMTEGSYKKKIVYFAIPIFFGSLFQQMYSTADSLIVGNFLGSSALAAVSSSGNLIFLLIGFIQGLTIGCSVVIARFIGARDHKMTSLAVHTTVALGLVSSLVLTLVGIFLAPQILRLMSTPEEIMDQSVEFFRMYFLGSAGFVMYNTLVSILQASGDSKHPVYYLIIASIINILLDLLFIGVFRFGVGAAGVATSISQTISALLALHQLMTQSGPCLVDLRKIRFQPRILKMIIKFGLPSGLQNSIIGLSNVIIQSYINFYGKNAVAGIGSYCKVEGFAFLPVTCFTMALTTFVAQNLGAKEYQRIRAGVRFGTICTLVLAEGLGILLFVFSPQLIGAFDSTPAVVSFGVARAHVCGPFFFLVAFTHVMAAVMRGAGKAMIPMIIMMICWCAVRILTLSVVGMFYQTIQTTYWVYPLTWFLSSLAFLLCYRRLDFTKL